jgi:hypothetical protein
MIPASKTQWLVTEAQNLLIGFQGSNIQSDLPVKGLGYLWLAANNPRSSKALIYS